MALKNTYSKLPAKRYIQDAQDALIKAGATGIQMEYLDGFVSSLAFSIKFGTQQIQFRLPVNWHSFQNVLTKEGHSKAGDDAYAYRVAWACTKDWIEAQMAFIESENVSLPQVFLPYAVTKKGTTLFEEVASNDSLLLGSGN